MGEKSSFWFSLRKIDGSWRVIVWHGQLPIFVGYGGNRDGLWDLAWRHLLAVQSVQTETSEAVAA